MSLRSWIDDPEGGAEMSVLVEPSTPDVSLQIGPAFLPEDAWQIHELVEHAPAGTRVEIDFRDVRECHDFALSLLATDILARRAEIAVHGLSHHQERVLRYFGVGVHHAAADPA
jgi:hypothetical protein